MKNILLLLALLPLVGFTQQSVFEITETTNGTKAAMPLQPVDFGKDITWIFPEGHKQATQLERMELGIVLPLEITNQINYFLETDDSTKGINPFLEWQLDITAEFTHESSGTKNEINAFYFEDFKRDTAHSDFRNWRWRAQETPVFMRIRFAPPQAGKWNCKVIVKSKTGDFEFDAFNFNVNRSNNKGYVKLGESNRFFKLGDETFFPAGQNLVSPRCEFCYVDGNKTLPGPTTGPALQGLESWMLEPTLMKGFLMFQDHMKSLSANGGNYFRELMIPQNQDIEWEKLGNYYGRMNRAWEMDEQLFLAKDLDLKIQLNLQIQFALEYGTTRTYWNWSVDPSDKRHRSAHTPLANPYNTQISTTENDNPDTFFSDATAKKFYKQKLRYIIARWGYSTNIAVFGMPSEMETSCEGPEECVTWMAEMGDYLKNDLKINQLLTPSFLGIYHNPEEYEHPIQAMPYYDMSTFNWYSVSPAKQEGTIRILNSFIERHEKPFFYGEMGNADLYPCDTARIEWVRDLWMSCFTGNAGTGLNWDDPFDDDLRKHIGHVNKFLKGIDFDNGGNPWLSQRIISDNRKAEMVCLMKPEKDFAVGVISNRYYNWYMFGDTSQSRCQNRPPVDPGFNPQAQTGDKGIWERTYEDRPNNYIDQVNGKSKMNDAVKYYPFEAFDNETSKHHRLRFYDLQRSLYAIDFYNALTLEYIGTRTNWGPNVKLEYPKLDSTSGMIVFKLRINRDATFPQIKEEDRKIIDFTNAKKVENSKGTAIKNNLYTLYFDNAKKSCTITLDDITPRTPSTFELVDETGAIVLKKVFKNTYTTVSFADLANKNYTIKLTVNNVMYQETIKL